jgi:hypothetical protein
VLDFRGRVPEKLQQSVVSVKDLGFHFPKSQLSTRKCTVQHSGICVTVCTRRVEMGNEVKNFPTSLLSCGATFIVHASPRVIFMRNPTTFLIPRRWHFF